MRWNSGCHDREGRLTSRRLTHKRAVFCDGIHPDATQTYFTVFADPCDPLGSAQQDSNVAHHAAMATPNALPRLTRFRQSVPGKHKNPVRPIKPFTESGRRQDRQGDRNFRMGQEDQRCPQTNLLRPKRPTVFCAGRCYGNPGTLEQAKTGVPASRTPCHRRHTRIRRWA